MKKIAILLSLSAFLASSALHAATNPKDTPGAETYTIDTAHSGVSFKVRNFFSQVPGKFTNFTGTIRVVAADPTKNYVRAVINAASVDTAEKDRDAHLQNEDFFNVTKFPEIIFESTEWTPGKEPNTYAVKGNLTMLGVTKPVTLDVTKLGKGEGRGGKIITGWSATTKLDRTDFGITYGRPAIGSEVTVDIDIQAVKQ